MSNNLHAHSKDPGFQAIYKLSQIEKENEALVKRINEELIPSIKKLAEDYELLQRVAVRALFELGGSIQISEEDYNATVAGIDMVMDPEGKIATFSLTEEKTEAQEEEKK